MGYNISGIQQVGIGVPNVHEAFKWYRQNFGMDIKIFEEAAEANLMLPYTGGKGHSRHAILAINMKGGGGFEIWQYTSRTPQPSAFEVQLGDHGLLCARMKTSDVKGSYDFMKNKGVNLLTAIVKDPNGNDHFFVKDPYGNIFDIVHGEGWFGNGKQLTGGPAGVMIGVSDIERSRKLYSDVLGYDTVVYDKEGVFDDLKGLPSGGNKARRVLLKHSKPRSGPFSRLLGPTQIELITVYDRIPKKVFENRFWGDLGYIHLCFDITGMSSLKKACEANGFLFTVDSANSFDMGEAAGHFSYIEDPDGTLIEFVETHKVPVAKKFGLYLNLQKRDPEKPLPNWMVKALGMNRVKD
jgi:catechol 2,3-dioxygenase-like lactoylglutathione lyase family enzyme